MSKPKPISLNLDEVKKNNPSAVILEIELGEEMHTFAFGRPKRTHVNMITSGGSKLGKKMANFVNMLLIAPAREEAQGIFDYYPAAIESLGNKLLEEVGLSDAEVRPLALKK